MPSHFTLIPYANRVFCRRLRLSETRRGAES